MNLLIFLINLLLSILSVIGDFILFYFRIFINLIKLIINFIKKYYPLITKGLRLKIHKVKKSVYFKKTIFNNKIKLGIFKVFLKIKKIQKNIHSKKYIKYKKVKKTKKQITIYTSSPNVLIKSKYFVLGFIFSVIFLLLPFFVYYFLNSLPNPKQLSERQIPQTTKIYDRNNNLLYQIYANENRTLVPLSSIPQNLINATIAIEDKEFYKNPGFNITSIIRAAISNFSGKPIQGGSTITQQLIKSTLLSPEVSVKRKIKELILAIWAEKIYSKNQILEMYFNQVPYGGTAWGIQAAAETYFGKDVNELNLAECAFLAGMPQSPTTYSPYGQYPNLWRQRQKEVLEKMLELKYISKDKKNLALNTNLIFKSPETPIYAPHFVMYIKELLIKRYGLPMVEKGGLSVITSLDLNLQQKIENIVSEEVQQNAYLNLTNGAALITNPSTGDVLAMVGSKNYNDIQDGNVNLTTALRQPGSSIKLITYTAALSNGFTAATILEDSPISYIIPGAPTYSPVNYDGRFHGRVPLRIAFANSFNIPAVKTLQKIGVSTMVDYAKRMGITSWGNPNQYGLSITLGAAEVKMIDLATAYGTISNLGKKVELNPILKIKTYQQGQIYIKREELPIQVIDPGVAFIIGSILSDPIARSWEFGINTPLTIPNHIVSVKTGTTDNKRDNWTIGFNQKYLTAVWVGNNDNSPMSQNLTSGITGAAPIWNKIMTLLLKNTKDQPLAIPSNVVTKTCFGKKEYFLKGTDICPIGATGSAILTPRIIR